jgi:hypothetical protein
VTLATIVVDRVFFRAPDVAQTHPTTARFGVMAKWWVKVGDGASGPFSAKAIAKSVRAGRVRRSALVRSDGGGAWVEIDSVPALVAALSAPAIKPRRADDAVDRDERWSTDSRPLFIAAIAMTSLAVILRVAVLALAAGFFYGTDAGANFGPRMMGMLIAIVLYLWAAVGMTARKRSAYRLAVALHFLHAIGGIVLVAGGFGRASVEIGPLLFAFVAGVVTYMARASFRD